MNKLIILWSILLLASCTGRKSKVEQVPPEYTADWGSLSKHNIEPEWFKDAKFGIYFHWGPYSVPAYSGAWYPAWMYYPDREGWGGEVYEHHRNTFGEDFDYHDFIPMFKAERFDAADWADLFRSSGAKFAGPVAIHHDGFAMWDSEVNPWNIADMGPQRDITGELLTELRKRDMKTITTFHHSRNFQRNKQDTSLWAGNGQVNWNSHYPYHPDLVTSTRDKKLKYLYGNLTQVEFAAFWQAQVDEVVDKYAPDMIWFDSWLPQVPEANRKHVVAHHYNTALCRGQEPIAFCKHGAFPDSVALKDIEQGGKTEISEKYWLTDITMSLSSWSYTEGMEFKTPAMVVRNMIDVWSKKGVVLLNVSPRADGVITEEQRDVLEAIGRWMEKHSDAVYETRVHSIFGYGIAEFEEGEFGGQSATMEYTKDDIRFARSRDGASLYVYTLGMPDANTTLEIQHVFEPDAELEISRVSVLGSHTELEWRKDAGRLSITTPDATAMNELATVFKVEFKNQ